jgi:hypothetical protein
MATHGLLFQLANYIKGKLSTCISVLYKAGIINIS